MTIENTLERIATALEKIAGCACAPETLEAVADLHETASGLAGKETNGKGVEKKPADLIDWSPYDAEIQKVYKADKQAVLDDEIATLGITFTKTNPTGAEKHQAIHDHNADTAVDIDPLDRPEKNEDAVDTDPLEPTPETNALPEGMDRPGVRKVCVAWVKANGKDNWDTLIMDVFGVSKFEDIPDERLGEAYHTFKE